MRDRPIQTYHVSIEAARKSVAKPEARHAEDVAGHSAKDTAGAMQRRKIQCTAELVVPKYRAQRGSMRNQRHSVTFHPGQSRASTACTCKRNMSMKNSFLLSVAAAALFATTGFAAAQGMNQGGAKGSEAPAAASPKGETTSPAASPSVSKDSMG
jgi:hypothetical protein